MVVLLRARFAEAAALALHEKLAAKMSVVIDGGGRLSMGDLLADIRLKAMWFEGRVFWQLSVGGRRARRCARDLSRPTRRRMLPCCCSFILLARDRLPVAVIWIYGR